MNPLLMFVIEQVVKYFPALAIEIIQLLSKQNPTDADWDLLKSKWNKSYDQYINDATHR